MTALLFVSPVQGPVIAYKLGLAVVAAIVGMAFDFLAFPYALPSGYLDRDWRENPDAAGEDGKPDFPICNGYHGPFCAAMTRRALLIAALCWPWRWGCRHVAHGENGLPLGLALFLGLREGRAETGRCRILAWFGFLVSPSGSCVRLLQGPRRRSEYPPRRAQYRTELVRSARVVWGLDAPIAVFAAQVHTESWWRNNTVSHAGAQGLAQFMPSTARWLPSVAPETGKPAPFNPGWSLRALCTYDKWLWERTDGATDFERMAFTLFNLEGTLSGTRTEPGEAGLFGRGDARERSEGWP